MTNAQLVKPASASAIDASIARLAVAFQRQIDAGTIKVYRDTLSDLPLWAIEESELKLRRKGGTYFPTAPEWHQTAEQLIQDRSRQIMASVSVGSVFCGLCNDTGMRESSPDRYSHCDCRPTNPNYQQSRGRQAANTNESTEKR